MSGFDGEVKERTLFCGNLHPNVTEEILYELFLQAGPLEKVTLMKNKNYAFITFKHSVSVPYTIELMNGIRLYQRPLLLQTRTGTSNSSSQAQVPNLNLSSSPASVTPPCFPNGSELLQKHMAATSTPKVTSCSATNTSYHRSMSQPNFYMNQNHYSGSDGYEADRVHGGPGKTRLVPHHHNHRSMLPYGRTSTPDPRVDWNKRNSSFTHPAVVPSSKSLHTNTMTMKSSHSWQTPQRASKDNF